MYSISSISLKAVSPVAPDKTNVANKVIILAPFFQGSKQPLKKPGLILLKFTPYHNRENVSLPFLFASFPPLISTKLWCFSLSAVLGMSAVLSGSQCSKIILIVVRVVHFRLSS